VNRLLVVEDDGVAANLVASLGEACGYDVRLCQNGDVGGVLEEWGPTLVALDLVMPKVDGIEALNAIAKRGSSVPVVIITAYPDYLYLAERYAEARDISLVGSLVKPINVTQLQSLCLQFRSAA